MTTATNASTGMGMRKLPEALQVDVRHSPEHFNRNCGCTIPEYWAAEVLNAEVARGPLKPYHIFVALEGWGKTRAEAIKDLIRILRDEHRCTGMLRIL